jgi:hypothetical protein
VLGKSAKGAEKTPDGERAMSATNGRDDGEGRGASIRRDRPAASQGKGKSARGPVLARTGDGGEKPPRRKKGSAATPSRKPKEPFVL